MADELAPYSELLAEPHETSGLRDPEALSAEAVNAARGVSHQQALAPDSVSRSNQPEWTRVFQARAATRMDRAMSSIVSIVHHTPEGGEAGTLGVLNGDRAGFDFFVPRAGVVYKCNDFTRFVAWQAGDWNYSVRSVGIEIGDFAARSGDWPDELYREVARLDAWLIPSRDANCSTRPSTARMGSSHTPRSPRRQEPTPGAASSGTS